MQLYLEIFKSNNLSDTDDQCKRVGVLHIDSSTKIDELLDAARSLTDGQDDLETLNRMRVFRAPDGTEF